jgi:Fe(3+) dicitrate transport protein
VQPVYVRSFVLLCLTLWAVPRADVAAQAAPGAETPSAGDAGVATPEPAPPSAADAGAAPPREDAAVQAPSADPGPVAEPSAADAGAPSPVAEPSAADAGAPSQPPAAPAPATPPALQVQAPAEPEAVGGEPAVQEILVVGTRLAKTAGSAHVVGEAQLERFEYDDAHAALQQVPGVYVRQEDGIGLRPNIAIRGANPDRSKKITLLEDGILFGPAPYSAPAAYFFPLLTRMTKIRVLSGPSAIGYGPQTVGGAIDLVTRRIPKQAQAALDLGVGEYGYTKAHGYAGASTEQLGILIEGVHLHNRGFKLLPDGADTGSTRNEWMVKGSYLVDPHASVSNELGIKLTYSEESSNETYLGLSDPDFREQPYRRYAASALDRMDNHRTSVVLSHVLDAPEHHFKLTTHVYRHDFARSWRKINRFRGTDIFSVLRTPDDPVSAEYLAVLRGEANSATPMNALLIGPNARWFVNQGVQTLFDLADQHTGPIAHHLEIGLRLHHDRIERRHSEDAFDMIDGALVPIASEATSVTTANEANTLALAVHAIDAMSWGPLTLTPGLRVEAIGSELEDRQSNTKTDALVAAVMPGVGAFYSILPELGMLAGVYRGFSPPPPGEDKLSPEYSVNYEGGARLHGKRGRVELIGFFNDYSNMTDICTLSSGCLDANLDRQFDAGRARIYGFEAFADYNVPLGAVSLPLSAAYTYTRTEFLRDFQSSDPIYGNVKKGDEIPYVPRHQLNVTAGLDSRYLGVHAALTYVTAMREQAGSASLDRVMATDDLLNVDIGAEVPIFSKLRIYANLRNLFDQVAIVSRRPYGARPNAPRWLQVGIKGTLD